MLFVCFFHNWYAHCQKYTAGLFWTMLQMWIPYIFHLYNTCRDESIPFKLLRDNVVTSAMLFWFWKRNGYDLRNEPLTERSFLKLALKISITTEIETANSAESFESWRSLEVWVPETLQIVHLTTKMEVKRQKMLNYACKILYEKSGKMNSFSKIVSTNDSIKGKIVPLVRLLLIGQRGRTELHTFFRWIREFC